MRIVMMIEGQEAVSWSEWVSLARAAEDEGLDGLFRSDHYTPIHATIPGALDAWSTITALGTLTKRIRLGTLVSPITFRHPSVLARMVMSADHISGGRVELGMGTGWYEREHVENGIPFPDIKTRFELLEEQVEIVKRSWTEEKFDHKGKHYALKAQNAMPRPIQNPHPPIILGGQARRRSAALAAKFAQEYNVAYLSTEECAKRRGALDAACREANRDPSTLTLSLMSFAALGATRGDAEARVERTFKGMGGPMSERMRGTITASGLVGTIDDVAKRVAAYGKVGVKRIFLQHFDRSDLEAIALFGKLARAVA